MNSELKNALVGGWLKVEYAPQKTWLHLEIPEKPPILTSTGNRRTIWETQWEEIPLALEKREKHFEKY